MRIEDAVQDLIEIFQKHGEFPSVRPPESQGS